MHDNPRNEKYPARFENFHPLRSGVPIYVVDFFSRGEEKNGKILYVISRNARVKISQGQFEKVPLHPGNNWRGRFIRGGIRKDGIGNTSGERTSVSFLSSGGNGKVTEKEEEDYLLLLLEGTNRFGFLDPAKSRHGGGVVANSRNS